MTVQTFDQQALKAFSQALRTLGIPVVYLNAAGNTKTIKAIFKNKEIEAYDDPTRVVAPQPIIRVLSSDIDDRNTDTVTFTINSTVYYADQYIDSNKASMKISLRS